MSNLDRDRESLKRSSVQIPSGGTALAGSGPSGHADGGPPEVGLPAYGPEPASAPVPRRGPPPGARAPKARRAGPAGPDQGDAEARDDAAAGDGGDHGAQQVHEAAPARSPRSSNTGGKLPKRPRLGKSPLCVLQKRVDALHLRFHGVLTADFRSELDGAFTALQRLGCAQPVRIRGQAFSLEPATTEQTKLLRNRDVRLVIEERHFADNKPGWGLAIQFDALYLAVTPPLSALAAARELTEALLVTTYGERLNRIDLCMDVTGLDLDSLEARKRWDVQGARITDRMTFGDSFKSRRRIGTTIGRKSSGRVLNLYDKRCELATRGDNEKTALEESIWRRANWNGSDPVTRIEYQYTTEKLSELRIPDERGTSFRDAPEAALRHLTALWRKSTEDVRLIVPKRTRRHAPQRPGRCPTDPRWTQLMEERLDASAPSPIAAERKRGFGNPAVANGMAVGIAAADKYLPFPNKIKTRADASRYLESLTGEQKERLVTVFGAKSGRYVGRKNARELIARLGVDAAAEFMLLKVCAANSRVAQLVTPPTNASSP